MLSARLPQVSPHAASTQNEKTCGTTAGDAAGVMSVLMKCRPLASSVICLVLTAAADAGAVASAELLQNQTYTYGRFEARLRFAAGDGVISSFFLWKPGSEMAGTYWNELDFEKLGADCHLQTNPLYGLPMADHHEIATLSADLCGEYHTYAFEWTPSYIAYLVDGVEVRRDTGDTAAAFVENAASGMQIHLNIWPGDASFGGNFDPAVLPVQEYISWVQYSSFANDTFNFQWREEFDGGTLPSGWATGNWASPKNLSMHQPANATFTSGFAVLSLTADDATGFAGAPPSDPAIGGAPGPDPSANAGGTPSVGVDASVPPARETDGGAAIVAPPVMAPEGAGSAGASMSADPSGTQRPASSAGACSQLVSSRARSDGSAWLAALIGVSLIGCRRRR
jgi:endo-1,3-1,4-beta-glycanase ExoK